jgi:hypothetical protein
MIIAKTKKKIPGYKWSAKHKNKIMMTKFVYSDKSLENIHYDTSKKHHDFT